MDHTRKFRKRALAFLIDLLLAHVVIVAVFGWWAKSPNSNIRFGGSLLIFSRCMEMELNSAFLAQWDKVQDCNTTSDFIFPNRELALQKVEKAGSIAKVKELRFSLDESGRAIVALEVDWLMFIVLFFGASLFEASTRRATPGKILVGLRVSGIQSVQPKIKQTLTRNFLKLLLPLYCTAQAYFIYLYTKQALTHFFEKGGQIPELPSPIFLALTYGLYANVAINLVILSSLFFPFRRMGRALYDRAAGTAVQSNE
jgi:uncharacterized RDD family membrane protein YckC